ncbi:MAG TPA: hypothetical protein PK256_21100 [Verrucomicrobiota bacterium]|nr:hypothetical protein [Verrucomicrobiota bacterium]
MKTCARRSGHVYAILLPKDDQETLPKTVVIPTEILAGKTRIHLLGFGELKPTESADGKRILTIPDAAHKAPMNYAWVFKLER